MLPTIFDVMPRISRMTAAAGLTMKPRKQPPV